MNTLPEESLQQLIWNYLEGNLSEEQELSLQQRLKSDPSARKFYLHCTAMQSILHWEHSSSMEEEPAAVRESVCERRPVVVPIWQWVEKSGIIPIGIAAAFIGVFALLGVHFLQQEDDAAEHAALVEAAWSEQAIGTEASEGQAALVFGNAPAADDSEGLVVPLSRGGESGHSLLFNFESPQLREG
tara:strand:+ start:166 stop:723 length:558 start_codon:yes stop_codon:yes gene_type:complete